MGPFFSYLLLCSTCFANTSHSVSSKTTRVLLSFSRCYVKLRTTDSSTFTNLTWKGGGGGSGDSINNRCFFIAKALNSFYSAGLTSYSFPAPQTKLGLALFFFFRTFDLIATVHCYCGVFCTVLVSSIEDHSLHFTVFSSSKTATTVWKMVAILSIRYFPRAFVYTYGFIAYHV